MGRYIKRLGESFRRGDMLLLLLCLMTTAFGCLIIASATSYTGSLRQVIVQIVAAGLGVIMYMIASSIDAEFFSEHRTALVIFNTFLLLLLIPFGTDNDTGNKSWLDIPLMPVDIQPAEVCKLTYILIMASVMSSHQNKISSIPSVLHMVLHLGLLVGLNMALSRDAGVSLIFVFIFVGMAFAGGVNMLWFLLAAGAIAIGLPILWPMLDGYQQDRIKVLTIPLSTRTVPACAGIRRKA